MRNIATLALILAAFVLSDTTFGKPPPAGTVRLMVGGDARNDSAHVVPWAFERAQQDGVKAFIFLGDMELTHQLDRYFEREVSHLKGIPFYPVVGNHEVLNVGIVRHEVAEAGGDFAKMFLVPLKKNIQRPPGVLYYSADLPGGVHFIALDNVSQAGFGEAQLKWLEGDLRRVAGEHGAPRSKHIIVGMHKALANNGVATHAMGEEPGEGGKAAVRDSEKALDLFEHYKVATIFASHKHEYAAFVQRGIPSYITGGMGAPLAKAEEGGYHHILEVDVTDAALVVTPIPFEGAASVGDEEDEEDVLKTKQMGVAPK